MSKKDEFLDDVVKQSTSVQTKPKKTVLAGEGSQEWLSEKLKRKYAEKKANRMLQTVTIRIPVSLFDKLNEKAKEHDVSIGALSRDLLEMSVDHV